MARQPSPERLVLGYHRRLLAIRDAASTRVAALWASLGAIDDSRFPAAAAATSVGAQASTVALTDAYFASFASYITGEPTRPVGVVLDDLTIRAGADLVEVYERPIITARKGLADGKPWAEAMRLGLGRATRAIETDVILAQQAAVAPATASGAQAQITRYRRVLTGASCGICASAAGQTYSRSTLMPIHTRCDCGVAPIVGGFDPAGPINEAHISALAGSSAIDAGARHLDLTDSGPRLPEVAVRDHGELGPVLTRSSDAFTGPDDL